jgi:hypothetical protein
MEQQVMQTLKEVWTDVVFYTTGPDEPRPNITDFDEATDLCQYTRPGTYLLAPVAKVVEVEIPEETKPAEPYVGLEWRDEDEDLRRVLAIYNHPGDGSVCIVVGCFISADSWSTSTYEVTDLYHTPYFSYPTTTTPPRTEKRLVMLNGWTRKGFGDSV